MSKKEQKILDRQLDKIVDKLMLEGWQCTYETNEWMYRRLYRRMLVRLRDRIDEKLKDMEEAK